MFACRPQEQEVDVGVPPLLRAVDKSSKWAVTVAQTAAVIVRHDTVAPFIIVGAIVAACFASAAKKAINQRRPDGSPFTDPGMPSSHALVSMFLAVAWALFLDSTSWGAAVIGGAVCVSVLRVVCGHHTWPQIGVGASLGASMAFCWMRFGALFAYAQGDAVGSVAIWLLYLVGSAVFIHRALMKEKIGPRAA
mmetsp:Transcript_177565/g.569462  ORF Transcript_177565/g.569462 Transcript_177565/m.569462 type:complete len:193 (-) Transcript_177565:80-658(-)